tara:strand:- start:1891 stop:2478 length:588 start_codon:yes stop_codon:yes gene_type:complete
MISHDVKLVAVYDKLEKQIKALQLKHGIDGKDGADGISIKGDQGDRGHDGAQGIQGALGAKGTDGTDGAEGADGISVKTASIDFDNHLVITLSDGTEIDAGELQGGSGGDQYFRSGSTVKINNDNLKDFKNPVFSYTGEVLTNITYSNTAGVTTATKDFTYTGGVITQLIISSTTGTVTKTYNYTDGTLTSITET